MCLKRLRFGKDMSRSYTMGWRDGSEVKSTDCSSRGPEFNSQQPHGGSQPSVMGSDALFWCV
ncbi:rCG63686 [Rattus norvegicus]|uniref:RCG63686 n=1 Tax=Rattus norvegicus TaxID=10116 RepID=A6HR41_RAT|nr:rCG63686 [Rattus norvegicus]